MMTDSSETSNTAVLEALVEQLAAGNISREDVEDVLAAVDTPATADAGDTAAASGDESNLDMVLYAVGSLIIFVAIVVLVQQQWERLIPALRVGVTLGGSFVALAAGFFFQRSDGTKRQRIASSMYGIHLALLPVGLYVLLNALGIDSTTLDTQLLLWTGLALTIGGVAVQFRDTVYRAAAIIAGSIWYLFFSTQLVRWLGIAGQLETDVSIILALLLALTWIYLGVTVAGGLRRYLAPFLRSGGTILALLLLFAFGGWEAGERVWMNAVIPLVIAAAVVLSERLHSQAMLFIASFFLMVFIAKLTALYFSAAVGWPIALLVAGCAVIGIGYSSVQLRSRISV